MTYNSCHDIHFINELLGGTDAKSKWDFEDSKSKCKICWCLDCTKNMKNTAEVCHAAGGAKPPKSTISNTKKAKGRPQSPKD